MVIVVTGASQGIGRAIAVRFAEVYGDEASIALVSRSEDKLERVAELCEEKGSVADVFPCDLTEDEAVYATAKEISNRWALPDVVVNNAGLFEPGPITETSLDAFRRQVEVNLNSAFAMTDAFLDGMVDRGSGHLFYTASVASIKAYPGGAAYGSAKHGLLGLARNVREETKEAGIRVTAIIPGATYTPSWEGSDLPEERFMPPEDIAATVVHAHQLSDRTVMEEVILRPQKGDV